MYRNRWEEVARPTHPPGRINVGWVLEGPYCRKASPLTETRSCCSFSAASEEGGKGMVGSSTDLEDLGSSTDLRDLITLCPPRHHINSDKRRRDESR